MPLVYAYFVGLVLTLLLLVMARKCDPIDKEAGVSVDKCRDPYCPCGMEGDEVQCLNGTEKAEEEV